MEYKNIDNTRYVISRVFSEDKTTSMLIEERVKNMKNSTHPLTNNTDLMYNRFSGSIQKKEEK